MNRQPVIAITARTEELRDRPQTTLPNTYARVIEDAGGIPLIIPITDKKEHVARIAGIADAFLFSGGDDIHPRYYGEEPLYDMALSPDKRTQFELELFKEVVHLRKPALGICLGAQLINIALGGSLFQDIPSQIRNPLNHRGQHNITVVEGTMLYDILSARSGTKLNSVPLTNDISIFSTHHQSVRSSGKGLVVSAASTDGVIEAIELPDYPFLIGVQWHPEMEPDSAYTKMLLRAFINSA
ncbi:MAG: gamma-glutamyl-gamma-aminobutyrate hydrolase family protein [Nitrospirae bacterium]|nr:gamma-glutamyl-gamma-aminobutyrate hydrolase family protein [Nitrospirota bacterium]